MPYHINSGATLTDMAQNQLRDTNVYTIIHTATSYISWETIEQKFIVPFLLGDLATCFYIVDVKNITDPLFVFQNYGEDGRSYLHCHTVDGSATLTIGCNFTTHNNN